MRTLKIVVAVIAAFVAVESRAVYLSNDGLGQALVYPYYTAKASRGNPFNTYISIVNESADAKALRVRLRTAQDGRVAASFNVFLSAGDVWTAAVVPSGQEARLITADRSCTSPTFVAEGNLPPGIALIDPLVPNFGLAAEGWIQVLEMATLHGASAAAVTQDANGVPANCAAVQGGGLETAAPTGGLSGTLTLINVASGMDFTMNAEALAELGTRPYYRVASDPYPEFNVAEIDPISIVVANGSVYRSIWTRPQDAVSAVFMRRTFSGEFVLDPATNSRTDFAITYPTRQFYVTSPGNAPPFSNVCEEDLGSGERVLVELRDREHATTLLNNGGTAVFLCRAVANFDVRLPTQSAGGPSAVRGSESLAIFMGALPPPTVNGWIHFSFPTARSLTSESSSTRTSIASGIMTAGAHTFTGLPMTGFMVRTLENGTLACSTGSCQGNYGGNMPLQFTRTITP